MTKTLRRLGAAALAVLAALSLTACATYAESDEILLFYKAGPTEETKFDSCVKPSAAGSWQFNNRYHALPTSLRTWNVQPQGGDTNTPASASSRPADAASIGPVVNVWFTMDFYLNTSCEGGKDSPIVQFWERTGRRYGLSDNDATFSTDAWRKMLEATLVPSLTKAVGEAARKYGADQMDSNQQPLDAKGKPIPGSANTWALIEADIAAMLSTQMREKIQGDYFCGPEFTGGGPATFNRLVLNADKMVIEPKQEQAACPPLRISITDIAYADQNLVNSRTQIIATEQANRAAELAAESKKKVADILAQIGDDPNYIRLQELETARFIAEQNRIAAEKCAAAGANCTIFVNPNGAFTASTK